MPGESVEVLSFEIGWEMEAWRVSGQTDKQTEWQKPFFIIFYITSNIENSDDSDNSDNPDNSDDPDDSGNLDNGGNANAYDDSGGVSLLTVP